jgi:hypothetical protein
VSAASLQPPTSGLIAMRIGQEFGSREEFVSSVTQALARGGERGATIVALLDRGDLSVHIPSEDGPCWNSVPLLHLHGDEAPADAAWGEANDILEKLERYR